MRTLFRMIRQNTWWLAIALLMTQVQAIEPPVISWHFESEETTRLKTHGGVLRDQPGPRPPHFPDFDPDNDAVMFTSEGDYLSLEDPGEQSPFDFTLGDTITVEAWVDLHELGKGQSPYVIGKGRTGNKKFAPDNQNWALRVREVNGEARLNFLFATPRSTEPNISSDAHWHRWTSRQGFAPGSGWHRVAISYQFGEPESIRGWIDDQPQTGTWDMGGSTTEGPVVDEDEIEIGATGCGAGNNRWPGMLDAISIFRTAFDDDSMLGRYTRQGAAPKSNGPKPALAPYHVRPGSVMLSIREGLSGHVRFPSEGEIAKLELGMNPPTDDLAYFYLHRMPRRYDDFAVRESWKAPLLAQVAGDVAFPAGTIHLVVRSRGLGRLWIDDEIVAETSAHHGSTDGHNPVEPVPSPPLEGHAHVNYGDHETIVDVNFPEARVHRVVLESIVGGEKFRAECGELLVGYWTDSEPTIRLLQSAQASAPEMTVTTRDLTYLRKSLELALQTTDRNTRRHLAKAREVYWQARHDDAAATIAVSPPDVTVDYWIARRLVAAEKADLSSKQTPHDERSDKFQSEVLPILREHCFRCHSTKVEGGLQLTSLELAKSGGDSGESAIVPNHPEQSLLVQRIFAEDEGQRMPPSGKLPSEQAQRLVDWIRNGADWSHEIDPRATRVGVIVDDASFLRRVSLDTIGLPPSEAELRAFLSETSPTKRLDAIERLLADPRYADHWVSFWQDLLAENPNVLKPSLNNTGPFRWFLHDALQDNWPMDRMMTELLMLRGGKYDGGAAGFGMAADNDAPTATRTLVAASALLGIQLQCARCHDAPYHDFKQRDLFSMAAMLDRKPITVPPTSSLAPGFFDNLGGRESLVKVTLTPGEPVEPEWHFASETGANNDASIDRWLQDPADTRERLAYLITGPDNTRFASVVVNHYWKRFFGAGIVEPADDWEKAVPSDPELLSWLSNELIRSGYNIQHVIRLILNSNAYQRSAIGINGTLPPDERFFASPDQRRLTAEQVTDSLYFATGRSMDVEELTFDPEARRASSTMATLGHPHRAWEFSTLSNERDRPSLSLPRAQAVTDVLEAFGWTGSRQSPIVTRADAPSVLQSGMLANGVMSTWVTRASVDSELANIAVSAPNPKSVIESLYLRLLTRFPQEHELIQFCDILQPGFETRWLSSEQVVAPVLPDELPVVSWSNHLRPEANSIQIERQQRARAGEPVDPRLEPTWREAYEDVVWAIVNSPEFVFIP